MAFGTGARMLRFVLPALAAALIAPLPQTASAQDNGWREERGNDARTGFGGGRARAQRFG